MGNHESTRRADLLSPRNGLLVFRDALFDDLSLNDHRFIREHALECLIASAKMEAQLYGLRPILHPLPSPTMDVDQVEPKSDKSSTGTISTSKNRNAVDKCSRIQVQSTTPSTAVTTCEDTSKNTSAVNDLVFKARHLIRNQLVPAPVSPLAVLDWCILRRWCPATRSPLLRVGLDVSSPVGNERNFSCGSYINFSCGSNIIKTRLFRPAGCLHSKVARSSLWGRQAR
jgi:hypothetical protein